MVQFSENIKNAIKKLADKKHAECELIPYQMDINENGFIQDIPSGLEPYKLESKQAQELLRLIDVHDDAIFSIALNQSIDDEENNFSHIEFTRTTFHFYLVYRGIHELHTLMNKWKSKGVDIVAVSIKNNDCTGV